jgi:hypothetical protein
MDLDNLTSDDDLVAGLSLGDELGEIGLGLVAWWETTFGN